MILSDILLCFSFIITILGTLIVIIFVANIKISKLQKKVSSLINKIDIEKLEPRKVSKFSIFVKRVIDIVFSVDSIILFAPIFIILSIAIKLESKGPILVKRKRLGKEGKYFYEFRFRTHDINDSYKTNGDIIRFTKVGNLLNITALEQLPLILNVLIGEMSLVGRSPYNESYYELVPNKLKEKIIHEKPGIVSLWTLSYDNKINDINSKIYFDVYYANKKSIRLDVMIILKAVALLLAKQGNY